MTGEIRKVLIGTSEKLDKVLSEFQKHDGEIITVKNADFYIHRSEENGKLIDRLAVIVTNEDQVKKILGDKGE